MTKAEIKDRLISLSEADYKAFNEKLKPSNSLVIGVRMGHLRKIAKELAKRDWRKYVLSIEETDSYEEKLISGMSIYYSKSDIDEKIEYTEKVMPFVDGWAICDCICSTVKLKEHEKEVFWNYCKKCALSGEEFRSRVGLIAILNQFIEESRMKEIFSIITNIEYRGYYDSMGAAWLLAQCMTLYPETTFEFMKNNTLNDWVYNKSITKMRESYRINREMKDTLKLMMRK